MSYSLILQKINTILVVPLREEKHNHATILYQNYFAEFLVFQFLHNNAKALSAKYETYYLLSRELFESHILSTLYA